MTKSRYPDIEPIPDSPENVARAIMQGPPKEHWRFEERRGKESSSDQGSDEESGAARRSALG